MVNLSEGAALTARVASEALLSCHPVSNHRAAHLVDLIGNGLSATHAYAFYYGLPKPPFAWRVLRTRSIKILATDVTKTRSQVSILLAIHCRAISSFKAFVALLLPIISIYIVGCSVPCYRVQRREMRRTCVYGSLIFCMPFRASASVQVSVRTDGRPPYPEVRAYK